ncbi:hypothetical protein ABIQ69_14690 [Agromyces sp. G08B096]|uniref:Lipoprotein n=1 Tax=Agromyces sp. G08B096 TaxID=3156399 RepID=A0AAU7W5X5_9MICO
MRVRSTAAFVVSLAAAAALLSGCAGQWPDHRDLVGRLEGLEGVLAVTYDVGGGTLMPAEHRLEIVVEASLSEADARRIAQETCAKEVALSMLTVTTEDDLFTPGAVLNVHRPSAGVACIAERGMVDFARASAAMQELRPGYQGRFNVSLDRPADGPAWVSTSSTDRSRLVDAVRTLRAHLPGVGLEFEGEWDENRDEVLPDDVWLTVRLSAEADLDPFIPIIELADELGTGSVTVDDAGITVELLPETPAGASASLTELATQTGVALTVVPPPAPVP